MKNTLISMILGACLVVSGGVMADQCNGFVTVKPKYTVCLNKNSTNCKCYASICSFDSNFTLICNGFSRLVCMTGWEKSDKKYICRDPS